MIRRGFMLLAATIPSVVSNPHPYYNASQVIDTQNLDSPYPYEFPPLQTGSLADSGQFPMPLCHGFKLEEASIDQLQHELSQNRLTTVKLVMCYLQRILQVDDYTRYALSSQVIINLMITQSNHGIESRLSHYRC